MAFEVVNPLAAPWLAQGLKCLMLQGEFKEDLSSAAGSAQNQKLKVQPKRREGSVKPAKMEIEARQPAPHKKEDLWTPLPVENWPQVWRERLGKTKKARFAWTYWELGSDLDQMDDASLQTVEAVEARRMRSAFLRQLLADLNHPAGTHTFWPCALREQGMWKANPDVFWSGLHELKCRGVIIFGSSAVKELLNLDSMTPLTRMRIYSQFVWLMWDLKTLTANKSIYGRLTAYLKETLRQYAG